MAPNSWRLVTAIGQRATLLVFEREIRGNAAVRQLWPAIPTVRPQSNDPTPRLEVVGTDGNDSDVVEVTWFQPCDGNGGL